MNSSSQFLHVVLVASLAVIASCGGGGSGSGSQPPPPPPPQISSVSVSPQTVQLVTGSSQSFSASVTGTGAYNSGVTWSVNGVAGGNGTYGMIVNGQYTAPAALPNPASITITATSVQDPTKFGSSTATIMAAVVLNSITPSSASAGEVITVDATFNGNVIETPQVVFSGKNGTSLSMPLQIALNSLTVQVPFGATSGPININIPPQPGGAITVVLTSNSIQFTRLPNLRVHASQKDLSSGETLQLDWRLLGASTPNVVKWTGDSGSVSSQGVFQAPIVSTESYSRITGCVQNTNSCNSVLVRISPFRITPADSIVNIDGTLQLDALQGGSFLSPQWSVLSGGGTVTSAGIFTAPTTSSQAGSVPISATAGSTTEQTSVAVAGAFPGLVNRVYDYSDFTTFTPKEATFVESVAVSGNRAYAITTGNPYYHLTSSFEALDIYDISNPDQPVWLDSVESPTEPDLDYAFQLYAYGNTLFSIDSSHLVTYDLTTPLPTLTGIMPFSFGSWSFSDGVLYVTPAVQIVGTTQTLPIDLYDFTTGTVVHRHYELPQAPGGSGMEGIAGKGNTVYLLWSRDSSNGGLTYTIETYDISQSPPMLLGSVSTTASESHLYVTGNTLIADSQIYDISNRIPVQVGAVAIPITIPWGMQGNSYLATGGWLTYGGSANYAVIDLRTPSNPVVTANVVDLMIWDVFNPFHATWAANGRFYTADGTGGIGVYNVTAAGGPPVAIAQELSVYVYDQVLEQQTLYQAAYGGPGGGKLQCIDVSSGNPNLLGELFYANDAAFAVQVSGTTAFLGLADSLKVIDVSNPTAPVEIGSVAVPVNALALSGGTLFVGTGDGRLMVFDISTPASPKQLASVAMAIPNTIRLSGNLLLVAAAQNGMLVFDVSHPSAPMLLSQFLPTPSASVWDIAPIGSSAVMLAADSSGIVTVDISSPSNPQQLHQEQLPFLNAFPAPSTGAGIVPAFSLASQNGLTYVGTSAGMMFAFDSTVAVHPRLMSFNVVGLQDTDVVSAITPDASSLIVAVQGVTVQFDNTVPQNSIELLYPPLALAYSFPISPGYKSTSKNRNLKADWMSRRSAATGRAPDRFGVMTRGQSTCSTMRGRIRRMCDPSAIR